MFLNKIEQVCGIMVRKYNVWCNMLKQVQYTQLKAGGIRIQAWCMLDMSINHSKPSRSNYDFSYTIIYICTSGNYFETSWEITYFSYITFLEILMELYR